MPLFGMREPYHPAPRVDAGAREHCAVFIEKRELAVAHAADDAGSRAIVKLNVKRGMRPRVPIAPARGCRHAAERRADDPQKYLQVRLSIRPLRTG